MNPLMDRAYLDEFDRCAEDFFYFCETYVKIDSYDTKTNVGLVPFVLYDYQKRLISEMKDNPFVIAKNFRLAGFSTLIPIYFLWRCMFKSKEVSMCLSQTDRNACSLTGNVRLALKYLPDWLMPRLDKCNDHQVIFQDTGCRFFSYTSEAACGRHIDNLFIDNAAFQKDMNKNWKAIYPTLYRSQCFVFSTPNGTGNWFHKMYEGAEKAENRFHVYKCHYKERPEFASDEWTETIKINHGDRSWRQEVLCEFLDPKVTI